MIAWVADVRMSSLIIYFSIFLEWADTILKASLFWILKKTNWIFINPDL